jgi:tetratricopeptide (TPR) repeat protein
VPNQTQHEETVVPVRPGLSSARPQPAGELRPARSSAFWQYLIGGALVVATLFVFAILPRLRDGPAEEPAAAPVAVEPAPAAPPLSPEERERLRAEAEQLLANLLSQQRALETLSAASWAGDAWPRYQTLITGADDAYLAADFARSVAQYTEATAIGEELLARSEEIVGRALAAGQEAFAAGNADVAIAQADIVLGIEPDNAAAQALRARAERLPEVLSLVERGDTERDAGEHENAMATYREALAIDPDWRPASDALAAVAVAARDAEFERLMSAGYGALAAEDYASAKQSFAAALAARPSAREAQDGITQAEQGIELDQIALTEARALAFERRELWDQAIAQYRAALDGDPNLVFAQQGLDRSEARAGLDAKLRNLIDKPTLLFNDTVLGDARLLIDEARAVPEPGPRLEEQIAKLDRLVALASTPIVVRLTSDQLTAVTLYRVGELGTFAAKEVELRPGTYTVIGSRNGYRDVRQTFTVVPGRTLPPVSVICVEPIDGQVEKR